MDSDSQIPGVDSRDQHAHQPHSLEEVSEAAFVEQLKKRTPRLVITPILLSLNVLIFGLMLLEGVSPLEPTGDDLIAWGADFGPLTLDGQQWRILTSNFLHIGFVHLGFNMWCLWDLGRLAERLFGNWTFLMLYVLSGLGGSVLSLWWNPTNVTAGASGAIFGVAGSLLVFWQIGRLSVPRRVVQHYRKSLSAFVVFNLLYGNSTAGVDNAAHVGGLLVGLLIGAHPNRSVSPDQAVSHRPHALVYAGLAFLLVGGLQSATIRMSNDPWARTWKADRLVELGDRDKAIAAYETILASTWDWRDYDRAAIESWILYSLGSLYQDQERYSDAEALFRRWVDIDKKRFGPHDRGIEPSLTYLANVYFDQGKYEEAEPLYERALAINEKTHPSDHVEVARSASNLGLVYYAQDKNDDAEPLFERALAIRENALGREHEDVADSLNNLALVYFVGGKYDEAEPLYGRALSIWERARGEDHPDVAMILENYAELLRALNRDSEASEMEARAGAIRQKSRKQATP